MCPGSICGLRFAAKVLVKGLRPGKGPRQGSPRRTIRRPGKPRKAVVSLQIIAIPAEWVKSNPWHCSRGISQRQTMRASGAPGRAAIDCVNAAARGCPSDPAGPEELRPPYRRRRVVPSVPRWQSVPRWHRCHCWHMPGFARFAIRSSEIDCRKQKPFCLHHSELFLNFSQGIARGGNRH